MHEITDESLLAELNDWVRQHVSLDAGRIPEILHHVRFTAGEDKAVQKMAFKTTYWLFGLDDVYDGDNFSLAQLQAITNLLLADEPLAAGLRLSSGETAVIHDLKNTLLTLVSEVEPDPLANRRYYEYLTVIIKQTIICMHEEAIARIGGLHKDIDAYLAIARYSVGVHLVLVSICYLMDKELYATDEYTWQDDLVGLAAEILRLLNDRGTYKKELAERKPNSVSIIQKTLLSPSAEEAEAGVDEMIKARIQQLKDLAASRRQEPFGRMGDFMLLICETAAVSYAVRLLA